MRRYTLDNNNCVYIESDAGDALFEILLNNVLSHLWRCHASTQPQRHQNKNMITLHARVGWQTPPQAIVHHCKLT